MFKKMRIDIRRSKPGMHFIRVVFCDDHVTVLELDKMTIAGLVDIIESATLKELGQFTDLMKRHIGI